MPKKTITELNRAKFLEMLEVATPGGKVTDPQIMKDRYGINRLNLFANVLSKINDGTFAGEDFSRAILWDDGKIEYIAINPKLRGGG